MTSREYHFTYHRQRAQKNISVFWFFIVFVFVVAAVAVVVAVVVVVAADLESRRQAALRAFFSFPVKTDYLWHATTTFYLW